MFKTFLKLSMVKIANYPMGKFIQWIKLPRVKINFNRNYPWMKSPIFKVTIAIKITNSKNLPLLKVANGVKIDNY